jgi:hypothetical protein
LSPCSFWRGFGEAVVRSTQEVAVGGLRLQVAGWFLVLVGIVVGTVANVYQAAS